MGDIIELINERSQDKTLARVSVIGKDDSFNIPSFSLYTEKKEIKNLKFFPYDGSFIGLSDFIVIKSGSSSDLNFLNANKKWFPRIFAEIKSYQFEDMSTVRVYQKKYHNNKYFAEKRYKVKKLRLAGFVFENISLRLSDFDESKGVYKKVSFFSPYASLGELDIYGLSGTIKDFSFIPLREGSLSDIMPFKIGKLTISSAKMSNYSISRYIESKNSFVRDVDVKLDKNFEIMAFIGSKKIFVEFLFKYSNGEFVFDLYNLIFSGISMPNFILKIFHFEYSLSSLPFKMDFNKVRIRGSMMEIS